MIVKLILLVLLLNTACQSGLIPCPTVKNDKVKKSNVYRPTFQYMAKADDKSENIHNKSSRSNSFGSYEDVSVEEWDCPRPGSKKYMPKSVKENIRKNFKKINKDSKAQADSVQSIR